MNQYPSAGCMRRATSKNRLCGLSLPFSKSQRGTKTRRLLSQLRWLGRESRNDYPLRASFQPAEHRFCMPQKQESTNRSCPGLFSVRLKPDRPTSFDRLLRVLESSSPTNRERHSLMLCKASPYTMYRTYRGFRRESKGCLHRRNPAADHRSFRCSKCPKRNLSDCPVRCIDHRQSFSPRLLRTTAPLRSERRAI